MKWKEKYATGSKKIDDQHKLMFAYSEDFREVLDEGLGEKTYDLFLETLRVYAEAHFNYEEGCMLAYKCPVACRNKKEHANFSKIVEKETARYQRRGFERKKARELLDMIDRWLDEHICKVDVQLKDCIDKSEPN